MLLGKIFHYILLFVIGYVAGILFYKAIMNNNKAKEKRAINKEIDKEIEMLRRHIKFEKSLPKPTFSPTRPGPINKENK